MSKKNNNRKMIKCEYSGKVLNGRKVISADKKTIIDYLLNMGYRIIPPKEIKIIKVLLAMIILIPIVSASLFTIDFSQDFNVKIMVIYFVIAGLLMFSKIERKLIYSGVMIFLGGIIFALNSINVIISLIIMMIGFVISIMEDKK